ncbi:Anhydro-N-acetylmuramic acid kinase, partial [Massariosphaeria phaeospora]
LDVKVLGVSSGLALDTIDCAIVHYRQATLDSPLHMKLIQHDEAPVLASVRMPILNLLLKFKASPYSMGQINELAGQMFSTAIKSFLDKHEIPPSTIDITSAQADALPPLGTRGKDGSGSQYPGWGTVIARDTAMTTVIDFRMPHHQQNRQRHALVELTTGTLLRHPVHLRACLNIDHIANLCFVRPASNGAAMASDCGPGTMFIDYAMRYCTSNQLQNDHDGTWGAQGTSNDSVVNHFMQSHDYFNRAPPARMVAEMFGEHEAQALIDECLFRNMSDRDIVATMTRITAANLVRQLKKWIAALNAPAPAQKIELFLCGAGARNPHIVDYLTAHTADIVAMQSWEDIGIRSGAKKAVCAAQLGLEALLDAAVRERGERPTAARPGRVEGSIAKAKRWDEAVEKVVRFG